MKKIHFKQWIGALIAVIFTLNLSFLSITAYADDSTTRSIVGDFFNKVFTVELTDGRTFMETDQDVREREKINQDIFDEEADVTYSLYDRFGGNINFIPYFGETKISTNLLDRFYDKWMDNDAELELNLDTIKMFFESPAISNNVIYEGRPNILSKEEIEGGSMDPRVYTYNGMSAVGGDAAVGNFFLNISNVATSFVAWLSGSGLYSTINNLWEDACNAGLQDLLQSMVKFFLPLAICFFVVRLVMNAFATVRGTFSARNLVVNTACALVSLGLIFSLMANPTAFGNLFTNITSLFDQVLDDTLQVDTDEVVASSQTDNVREATLWKKTVFDQWCVGMFGDSYEHLYTVYDEDAYNHRNGKINMSQSNDDVMTEWDDGTVRYNSAALTGDVQIPIGNGEIVRNWAALAWSTQSIYHIDAVKNEDTEANDDAVEQESQGKDIWPRALTTPMNDQIYVDNFRWIDAKLNISPEYHDVEEVSMTYSNSNNYEQSFISSGLKSIYMTLLLIPIGILAFRKVYYMLLLVLAGVKLCIQSLLSLCWPSRYNLVQNIKNVCTPIYDYLWWSVIIFIAINIYDLMAGSNLLVDFVWILISIWLIKFRPIRTGRQVQQLLNLMSSKARYYGGKVLDLGKSIVKK